MKSAFTSYQAAQTYLNEQLPMFQKIGQKAFKNDLTNIKTLCQFLQHPQNQYPTIHIAGTNGKGSVAHLLAALFQTKGLKVGLYTSPHYNDFRERIKINGHCIAKNDVVDFINYCKATIENSHPSFFEVTTAMAFYHFAQRQVDIAIIETGLGGRLDSTNILQPILSIITNISLDHQAILGNTLEKIALEKAGIIKPNVPVVIGLTQPEIQNIFIEKAEMGRSAIYFADAHFMAVAIGEGRGQTIYEVRGMAHQNLLYQHLKLGLMGNYQSQNLITVLQAVQVLEMLGWSFSEQVVTDALANVKEITNMIGRWEVLQQQPQVILDSAHNVAGLKIVLRQLENLSYTYLHIILGMLQRPDLSILLELFPKDALYYFVQPNTARGLEARQLQQLAAGFNLRGAVYTSVQSAYRSAMEDATEGDVIFVGGSTYTVAEMRREQTV